MNSLLLPFQILSGIGFCCTYQGSTLKGSKCVYSAAKWPHFYRADIESEKLKFCAIVILQRNIRSEPSIFTYVVSPLFSPFSYTHTYLLLWKKFEAPTTHTNLNFFSLDGATLYGAGGPLVVVILKVDSSHETFGSKLKQLSSRTVKKICCGEKGPCLVKKVFYYCAEKFSNKSFFTEAKSVSISR